MPTDRMLKKPASVVLASLRGSTYRSVRLTSSLAAALLDSLFEHTEVVRPCRFMGNSGQIVKQQRISPQTTNPRSARKRSPSPRLPLLGITMGDPAGIGPEVIAKALSGAHRHNVCRSIVIGSVPVMERTINAL